MGEGIEEISEELRWSIMLSLHVRLEKSKVSFIEICIHETMSLNDIPRIVEVVTTNEFKDVIDLLMHITKLLEKYGVENWKEKFEIYISESEIILNVLL